MGKGFLSGYTHNLKALFFMAQAGFEPATNGL
jgi:hypothetical protein